MDTLIEQYIDSLCAAVELEHTSSSHDAVETGSSQNLDHEYRLLEKVSKHLYKTLNDRMSQNRRRRNANLAIHRLPPEMTLRIFQECLPSYVEAGYFDCLKVLYSVCSCWKVLIDNTKSFWAGISSGHPPPVVAMALRKSGDVPLRIIATTGFESPISMQTFMDAICRHIDRWFDVSFFPWRWYITRAMTHTAAPILASLTLHIGDGPAEYIQDLFSGHFPQLRRLDLRHVGMQWDLLTNLTSLHVLESANLTREATHGLLKRSPNLTSFHFSSPDSPQWEPAHAAHQITLPYLRDLQLSGKHPSSIYYLLATITPPPHMTILHIFLDGMTAEETPHALRYLNPWQQCIGEAIIASGKEVNLTLNGGGLVVHTGIDYNMPGYDLTIQSQLWINSLHEYGGFVSWHADIINRVLPPGIPVEIITGSHVDFASEALLTPFFNLPRVTSLFSAMQPEVTRALLNALSRPILRDGETIWLFPQLTSLRLHGVHSRDLLEMVRARLTPVADTLASPPAPFTKLGLEVCRKEDLEELVALLGDGCGISWKITEGGGSDYGEENYY